MQVIFKLKEEFRKSEFARTANPVPVKIEGNVVVSPAQAKVLAERDVPGLSLSGGVCDFSYNNSYYAETNDIQLAFNGFISHCENEIRERKKQAAQEKERKEKAQKYFDDAVAMNRKIIGDKDAAIAFSFQQNNLTDMRVDQETYDYILQVRKEKEDRGKAEKEALKEAIKRWGIENGTELLKLRIEENMNWYQLANDEYFLSITPKGFINMEEPEESWLIKNADIGQIKTLREVRVNYPDALLKRYKYDMSEGDDDYENDDDRYQHKDVIAITLKSISGEERIVEKEI